MLFAMNFNVYLGEKTGKRLDMLAKTTRKTRNALIREAVERLLSGADHQGWPQIVRMHKGVPDFVPFESHRSQLAEPADDPLVPRR